MRGRSGFSVIELVVVLAILAVVAAIAVPRVGSAAGAARATGVVASMRVLEQALMSYRADHGVWPPDGSTGRPPSSLKPYLTNGSWPAGPPYAGEWDNERGDAGGVAAAVGIHFDGVPSERVKLELLVIDARMDDGDLGTGRLRLLEADRYYLVVEE